MRDSERAANRAAVFYPAKDEADNGGVYADPAIGLAGLIVHVYAEDGRLCVDVEPHEGGDPGVFGLYEDGCTPLRVRHGGERVYQAGPDGERYGPEDA